MARVGGGPGRGSGRALFGQAAIPIGAYKSRSWEQGELWSLYAPPPPRRPGQFMVPAGTQVGQCIQRVGITVLPLPACCTDWCVQQLGLQVGQVVVPVGWYRRLLQASCLYLLALVRARAEVRSGWGSGCYNCLYT